MSAALVAALEELTETLSADGIRKIEERIRTTEPDATHLEVMAHARSFVVGKATVLTEIALKLARKERDVAHSALEAIHQVAVR